MKNTMPDEVLLNKILTTDIVKQERIASWLTYTAYGILLVSTAIAVLINGEFFMKVICFYSGLLIFFLGKARAGYARLYRIILGQSNKAKSDNTLNESQIPK